MSFFALTLGAIRVFLRKVFRLSNFTDTYVTYKDQDANNFIYDTLKNASNTKKGLMIAKFGTYELDTLLFFLENNHSLSAIKDEMTGNRRIFYNEIQKHFPNMGFFPDNIENAEKFSKMLYEDIKQINILCSYIKSEKYLSKELKDIKKVNLDGFLAPYYWTTPWTKALENKDVLIISPFVTSMKKQYEKRELLFLDKNVLPKFKSIQFIKAVQSIAGNKPENYETWFDALEYMKQQINSKNFDIALIGCGAYGLPLAAYVKRLGKTGIHMAGWLQMLFGIYGNRWIYDEPKAGSFINEHWIRPSEDERPNSFNSIENGCYW